MFLLLAAFKEKSRLPFCLLSNGFGGQGPSLSYPALRAAPGTPWGGGLLVAQPTAPCTNMGVGSQSRKEGSVHPKLGGDERQRRGQATLAKDCITEHLEVDAV